MKIALIGPTYPVRGGISHFTTVLADHLAGKNEVTVFSLKNFYNRKVYKGKQKEDSSGRQIKCSKAKVNEGLSLNPFSWLRCGLRLRKFDIVIVNWWVSKTLPLFYALLPLVGKKPRKIFICHEVIPFERALLDLFFIKRLLSMADCCVVHSKQDEKLIADLGITSKSILLFHPTYSVFSESKKMSPTEAKKVLGVKGNAILFFGFVRPHKGLVDLIEAMPLILKGVDVTLLVVGEFWETGKHYLERIKELGLSKKVVVVPRYINNEEVPTYFSAADAVIVPYTYASQSGVIQMAFAFNKPVIATDVGGFAEAVKDGETGFIVEPNNPQELAEAVIKFYKEKKGACFEGNIKRSKKNFSWDRYTQALIDCSSRI